MPCNSPKISSRLSGMLLSSVQGECVSLLFEDVVEHEAVSALDRRIEKWKSLAMRANAGIKPTHEVGSA